jgi:hypothetical protein
MSGHGSKLTSKTRAGIRQQIEDKEDAVDNFNDQISGDEKQSMCVLLSLPLCPWTICVGQSKKQN